MTTYPNGIAAALIPAMDAVLGARDAVGAVIQPVYLVQRTWFSDSGKTTPATQPEGFATDAATQMLPTPRIKTFSQDIRLKEGGAIKSGDIILKNISKNQFDLADLDGTSSAANIENLFMIGVKMYQVINVTEKIVTWDVQIRELTNQERY